MNKTGKIALLSAGGLAAVGLGVLGYRRLHVTASSSATTAGSASSATTTATASATTTGASGPGPNSTSSSSATTGTNFVAPASGPPIWEVAGLATGAGLLTLGGYLLLKK